MTSPRLRVRAAWRVLGVLTCGLLLGGCSWVSSWFEDDARPVETTVFDIKPGQCFNPPPDVKVELATLSQVTCDQPHTLEAYAVTTYVAPPGSPDTFPGDAALTNFADGACAEAFTTYVGVDYRDSSMYYTYLLPSARSWQQGADRSVTCLVTTTGEKLTASVAGSQR